MIGMQGKDPVHRTAQDRVHLVFFGRNRKAHPQEIGRIVHIIARIHERLTNRELVGPGRDGRHLGDQPVRRDLALVWIVNVG